ncbi:hypothetical protein IMAU80009_02615 [Lactiplantibacillus plantarum]|nr:hypothetical protein [Lactiplantibacillus plantarum]
MELDIQVIQQDGSNYWLSDLGIQVEKFSPPAPTFTRTYTPVGKYNVASSETHTSERKIPLVFDVKTIGSVDQELMRLKLFDLFRGYEDFYVVSSVIPSIRWPVHVDDGFNVDPYEASPIMTEDITVNLVVTGGFGETINTTANMENNIPLGFDIPFACLPPYHFTNQSDLKVFVGGSIPLLADGKTATLTFHGDVASQLSITNKTTGQVFQLNQALKKSQTLILYGMVPVVDGVNVYSKGNHAYLDYVKGINELLVAGATNYDLDFDTRYYV